VVALDVEKLQSERREAHLLRSESLGSMMCLDTLWQRRNETVIERRMSAPSRLADDQIFTQKRNQVIATFQSENAPGGKDILGKSGLPKNTREMRRSRCYIDGKIVRSSSLNENSFVSLATYQPDHRTAVDELTNENGPPYDRFQWEKRQAVMFGSLGIFQWLQGL